MADLANADFMRGMCKSTMTMGEVVRMRGERAQIYADGQFKGVKSFLAQSSFVEVV